MSDATDRLLSRSTAGIARAARGWCRFAGYAMPIQYEGIIAEHRWTRESAGLFDVSHMGQLIVAGAEAEKGLESLLPADLAILKEGRLRYSLLLTEDGGIIDDLMVTRRGDHFYVVVNGATKDGDIAASDGAAAAHRRLDHMKEQALLALQGPKAAEALVAARARRRAARLHDRRRLRARRRPGLDQPLGLYRRGRLRDLASRRRAPPRSPSCSPRSPR